MKAFDTEFETEWDDGFDSNVKAVKLLSFADIGRKQPAKRRPARKPRRRKANAKKAKWSR